MWVETNTSFVFLLKFSCVLLQGVDVKMVLSNIGIQVGDTGERVGTVAIAYAAHKALSPVRFPPTVALTPVVANILGKKDEKVEKDEASSDQQ